MYGLNRFTDKLHKDNKGTVSYQFIESIIQSQSDSDKLILELGDIRPRIEKKYNNLTYFNQPDWLENIDKNKSFDFIYGELPFGMKHESYNIDGKDIKLRRNWINLFNAANLINSDGFGIFTAEPSLFSIHEGEVFEELLNRKSLYVSAIFNASDHPITGLTRLIPVYVIIKRQKTKSVFVASLTSIKQSLDAFQNYQNQIDSKNLEDGILIENKTFKGFQNIIIKQQINGLETQFKGYSEKRLEDIATEINTASSGKDHIEKENAIYIPKVGNSAVKTSISDFTIKHHNYIQVVLKEDVNNIYLAAFYRSKIGKLILQELATGTTIPNITKKSLNSSIVMLPPVREQELIVETQRKLDQLKKKIESFEDELALNPIGSNQIRANLNEMLNVIGGLSESDEIRALIRSGESKTVEFKETFCLDIRKKTKEKYIIEEALKTIVAFLNTEGGSLFIGVDDAGEIPGIENEMTKFHKSNKDDYLKHFKNHIKDQIGEEYYEFIDYKIIDLGNAEILYVKCTQSTEPCFLKPNSFYVRTNPATDKLEGQKLLKYVEAHFHFKD